MAIERKRTGGASNAEGRMQNEEFWVEVPAIHLPAFIILHSLTCLRFAVPRTPGPSPSRGRRPARRRRADQGLARAGLFGGLHRRFPQHRHGAAAGTDRRPGALSGMDLGLVATRVP